MSRRRPPLEITPKEFYESWLPAEVAARGGASAGASGAGLCVRMQVEGTGGGTFDLKVRPGALEPIGGEPPDITVIHSLADWRALIVGEAGGFDLLPEFPASQAGMLESLLADPMSRHLLAMLNGSIGFRLPGFAGRTFATTIHFGKGAPAAKPDVTVSLDASVYKQILDRTLPAPQAWFGGKVALEGDIGFAMQVGMALLPKLQGLI